MWYNSVVSCLLCALNMHDIAVKKCGDGKMKPIVYTKSDIFEQLRAIGAPRDGVVLMHTSLRAVGAVEGGAEGLLDAMVEYFTKDGGLLCVPTHTWHRLGKEITLDMESDDTCLGAFAAVAIRDGRGLRSENPTHSMVVFGDREKAAAYVADEPFVRSSTAPESCYGKLFSLGGKVLLLGVAQNRNTYIHAVEEILGVPNRMASRPEKTAVRRPSGEIVKRDLFLYDADFTEDVSWRFLKYDTPFRYHGCITDGFVGNAPAQLCDARGMKKTVELIFKTGAGTDVLRDEEPIPQAFYCNKR